MKAGSAFNMPYVVYRRKTIAARQKSIQRYPFHVAILEDSIIRDKMTLFLLPWPHSKRQQTDFIPASVIWMKLGLRYLSATPRLSRA